LWAFVIRVHAKYIKYKNAMYGGKYMYGYVCMYAEVEFESCLGGDDDDDDGGAQVKD
jgi:hypothetical protein